ncbi:hypothetical protein [Enterococcus phage vB_Efm10_KEN22]
MMYVDNLILTAKEEDGVIVNRHFNEVYIKIDATTISVFNRKKEVARYDLDDILYMQTQGHPRQFRMFQ